jgi:hypothetical protein
MGILDRVKEMLGGGSAAKPAEETAPAEPAQPAGTEPAQPPASEPAAPAEPPPGEPAAPAEPPPGESGGSGPGESTPGSA